MLNDSGIEIDEEFLASFLEESFAVLSDLKELMESFQGDQDQTLFESYGQQIDRIMGAALTLSLNEIGELAKMGKELGYKASQLSDLPKMHSMHGLLSQLTKAMEEILISIRKKKRPDYALYHPLLNRLKKASDLLGDLRSTVK